MPTDKDIAWFKGEFGKAIEKGVRGTPFTVDMLTAIACQETGSIWSVLRRKNLTTDQIVELCVGDTLDDTRGRKAFPKNKAELLTHPKGTAMFKVANDALKAMSKYIPGFGGAAANPNKFCHGYGVFQYDIQFFKKDPDYFLDRRWAKFEGTLAKAVEILKQAAAKVGLGNKQSLTDMEMARVAIAYNTGGYNSAKGLKQGHKGPDGKYYGENFYNFLTRAHGIGGAPASSAGSTGEPDKPPRSDLVAGKDAKVATAGDNLLLRSAPRIDPANIVARLPNGHKVRVLALPDASGFAEIRAKLDGDKHRGFASAQYLKRGG